MFKKKKPQQSAGIKKAGPFKKMERRFFSFFNDKSRKRRVVLMGMLAYVPAMTIAEMQKEDPSTHRTASGAEQVQQYRSEISQITRDGNTITINSDGTIAGTDAERAQAIEARTLALAARLANDTNISEKDAQDLTRMFMRDINDPVISRDLSRALGLMASSSAFLEEARAHLGDTLPENETQRAGQIISVAASMSSSDGVYGYLINYLLFFMFFQTGAEVLLRRGSRRDDKLKKEELIENFSERAAQIRAMLTPKGQEPRAAQTPPEPPAPAKRTRTGSTGPH